MLEAYEEMSYNLYNTVYYPSIPSEFSDKKDFIKNIDGGLISKAFDKWADKKWFQIVCAIFFSV